MRTLADRATLAIEVKKSRFVAHCAPVESPDEALAFVREVSVPDATHNCWAYRIGGEYRFNDDGEPGGTAGRPILAAIDGQGVDHVVAVVTRWYGGIKLGAGGLVRAYGGCAAECLRLADKVERVPSVELDVSIEFALTGALHALFAAHGVTKLAERYDADAVVMRVSIAADRREAFADALRDASRGRAVVTPSDVDR